MAILAPLLNVTGLILLTHAYVSPPPPIPRPNVRQNPANHAHTRSVYSAYEHTSSAASAVWAGSGSAPLPIDIVGELLFATGLLMAGIVLASAPLRPIRWAEWAGENERTKITEASRERGVFGNPFEGLEYRTGFVDVRARRKEFEAWVRTK
jgi:membrane magnesium transporter 1